MAKHRILTPDDGVAVVRGTVRDYADRHPGPPDAVMVVEVADPSVRRDRRHKRRIYARASVPVYWIIVMAERMVEVYADPTGPAGDSPAYAAVRRFVDGEAVPVVVDGREVGTVAVTDLLP